MDADEYRRLIEATESHWWFAATSALLEMMVGEQMGERIDGADAALRCLDAGGGTGATGSWLARKQWTALAEIEPTAIDAATERYRYRAVRSDVNHLPFADASFDVVLCVTVLCHEMNTDPARTVAELARVVRPGGCLVVLEPQHRWLWRGHDRVTHTGRRFRLPELTDMAGRAGLDVVRATGAFTFLVPPALALRFLERGKASSDVGRHESGLGGIGAALASTERRLLRRVDIPFGLSAVVVARKPLETAAP